MTEYMLMDIEKSTVDFMPNYDTTTKEPKVLPAAVPNLLLNGTSGIAVGMATNIPPHNASEVIDALTLLAKKPKTTIEELLALVQGPDFPTGGFIYNKKEIAQAYAQGVGPIVMRGKAEIVEGKRRGFDIVITEIPYEVRKAALIEQIADLVRDKKLEGIRDIRDESDREGLRVVVELKSDATPQRVLNALYKRTNLQRTFHLNMLALVDGIQPRVLSLKEVLEEYLKHRREVITRRSEHDLEKAKERAHILEGLDKALSKIDAVIRVIKQSASREDARKNLMKKFALSELQAEAILSLPLASLAKLEREKIAAELGEIKKRIKELKAILESATKLTDVLVTELKDVRERFGDDRRTQVVKGKVGEIADEDLIPDEQTVIVMTNEGYVKRLSPDVFNTQRRGGKGVTGVGLGEEEHVEHFSLANSKDTVLFFTSRGRVFTSPAYEIPQASRTSRGRAIVNFIALSKDETIASMVAVPKEERGAGSVVMVTRSGIAKRMEAAQLLNIRRNGLNAMTIKTGDALGWVLKTSGGDDIMLATRKGMSLRFTEKDLRAMGRGASGVKAVGLKSEDAVAGAATVTPENEKTGKIVVLAEAGFGKQVALTQYRKQKRGGRGIKTFGVSPATGNIVSIAIAGPETEELIAVSAKGKTIRTPLKDVRTLSRPARGTKVMKLAPGDRIASFTVL
jgi:DNA gyrase subunit A